MIPGGVGDVLIRLFFFFPFHQDISQRCEVRGKTELTSATVQEVLSSSYAIHSDLPGDHREFALHKSPRKMPVAVDPERREKFQHHTTHRGQVLCETRESPWCL